MQSFAEEEHPNKGDKMNRPPPRKMLPLPDGDAPKTSRLPPVG